MRYLYLGRTLSPSRCQPGWQQVTAKWRPCLWARRPALPYEATAAVAEPVRLAVVAEAQALREADGTMKGERGESNPQNTTAMVQVLGVGTDTGVTVPSVLLFFDRQRYLFNVGEGFQRFCVDHRIKLSKMGTVLMTRVTTEASGGLPGMLITMADTGCGGLLAGHDSITLHGPKGLTTLVNAFRTFVNVKDIGLKVREFESGEAAAAAPAEAAPVVTNDLVTITPVVIRATAAGGAAAAPAAAAAAGQANGSGTAAGEGEGEPEAKRARLDVAAGAMDIPSVAVESPAACYVCELPPIPGKFLPQKAASLGVPRGPLYGKLARGESVQAANGRTITPEEVMEPSTPGPVVLVVDCPSEQFVPALVSAPGLARWTTAELRDKVVCVVHLGERRVTRLPAYRQWISSCGPSATHLLVGESQGTGVPTLKGFTTLQARLNALDPVLHPLMHLGDAAGGQADAELGEGCLVGSSLLRYHLRPLSKKGLDREDCAPVFDAAAVQAQFRADKPDVVAAYEAAAGATGVPACVSEAGREEVEVTFLGTGAAVPSKYRNVTSILFNRFAHGTLLMDAGEGAYSQLRRRFGPGQADAYVAALRCIWISHIHADHHVGLPSLLAARTRMLGPDCPPLLVLGPRPLRRALQVYAQLEPMRFQFVEAANSAVPAPGGPEIPADLRALVEGVREALGLTRFESVRVNHCAHAYGLVLAGGEGERAWKVVFSADTRPCDQLVEAAKGATVFIHEATFEDSMLEEAVAKNHCTIGEAVAAGQAAGAFLTMLTHFSQRYPKVPVLDHAEIQSNIGIAFDMMSLNLADLARVPRLVPAATLMFAEPEAGDEEEGEQAQQ